MAKGKNLLQWIKQKISNKSHNSISAEHIENYRVFTTRKMENILHLLPTDFKSPFIKLLKDFVNVQRGDTVNKYNEFDWFLKNYNFELLYK